MKKIIVLILALNMLFLCSCTLFVTKKTLKNEKDEIFEDFKNVNDDFQEKKPIEIKNIDNQYGIELMLEIDGGSILTLNYKQNEIPKDTEIMCGEDFYIERQNKLGEWIPLETKDGMAWNSIGYTLSQGSTKSWVIDLDMWYSDVNYGMFRICKPFNIKENGEYYKSYVVSCEFAIIEDLQATVKE